MPEKWGWRSRRQPCSPRSLAARPGLVLLAKMLVTQDLSPQLDSFASYKRHQDWGFFVVLFILFFLSGLLFRPFVSMGNSRWEASCCLPTAWAFHKSRRIYRARDDINSPRIW